MTQVRTEYMAAVDALKRILKAQKITYRDLAAGLGMSESGIKKALGARDGSYERLAKMCTFAGISLADLLVEGEKDLTDVTYTVKQQEALMKEPRLLALYWQLAYERMSIEEIEAKSGLSKKESFRLLRQLDTLDLIELLPQGRLRIPPLRRIRWVGDGPLIRRLYKEWGTRLIQELARPDLEASKLFLIRYFKVSPKTYQDLLEAQRELEMEFLRRSIREMRMHPEGLKHVRWVAAIDDKSFVE